MWKIYAIHIFSLDLSPTTVDYITLIMAIESILMYICEFTQNIIFYIMDDLSLPCAF